MSASAFVFSTVVGGEASISFPAGGGFDAAAAASSCSVKWGKGCRQTYSTTKLTTMAKK